VDVDSGAIYRTSEEIEAAQAAGRNVVEVDPGLVEALDELKKLVARRHAARNNAVLLPEMENAR
jgi:hypothetical protein